MLNNDSMCGRTARKRSRKLKEHLINKNSKMDLRAVIEQELYIELMKWMGSGGFKFTKKLKPSNFKETGRGLMTKEKVLPGDIIISLPEKLLITPQKVKDMYLGPYLKRYCPNATGPEMLTIFIMCEKIRGKASPWSPYINTLPASYTIPASCNDKVISLLPCSLKASVLKQLQNIKRSFENMSHMLAILEQNFPTFHGKFDLKFFIWSWCSVNSRCVYMECYRKECTGITCTFHVALAPLLDLLNHSFSVKVKAEFNKQSNCYEIISANAFKRHSQVFINYGNHDNRKLFLEYGFVLKNNINDVISFSLDEVVEILSNVTKFNSIPNVQTLTEQNSFLSNNLGFCKEGMTWTLDVLLKIMSSDFNEGTWRIVMEDNFKLKEKEKQTYKKLTSALALKILENYSFLTSFECEKRDSIGDLKSYECLLVLYQLYSIEKDMIWGILDKLDREL